MYLKLYGTIGVSLLELIVRNIVCYPQSATSTSIRYQSAIRYLVPCTWLGGGGAQEPVPLLRSLHAWPHEQAREAQLPPGFCTRGGNHCEPVDTVRVHCLLFKMQTNIRKPYNFAIFCCNKQHFRPWLVLV
jgi:hypothetical protein